MSTGKYTIPSGRHIYKISGDGRENNVYTKISARGTGSHEMADWILPLPSALDYNTSYNWKEGALGHALNNMIANSPAGVDNILSELKKTAGHVSDFNFSKFRESNTQLIDTMIKSVATSGEGVAHELLRRVIKNAAGLLGNESAADEIYKRQGQAYNPNEQMYFDGVSFREFSYSFEILPLNKLESYLFASGYKQLRIAAAPDFDTNKFYFTYPSYFDIDIVVHGVSIVKRRKCVAVSTNLNMTNGTALTWGPDFRPTSYTLDLTFKETIVPTKKIEKENEILGI